MQGYARLRCPWPGCSYLLSILIPISIAMDIIVVFADRP